MLSALLTFSFESELVHEGINPDTIRLFSLAVKEMVWMYKTFAFVCPLEWFSQRALEVVNEIKFNLVFL